MGVIDIFTFNGENAILRLHLAILYDYVDKFIIVEANRTFTGQKKPMYFFRDQRFFAPWLKKIEYCTITDWDDTDIWELAVKSPNTKGASHWKREFYQKEYIQKILEAQKIKDNDLCLIGDVDEIIDPSVSFESDDPVKAKLRVYAYYLNNRSNEQFYGTLISSYKDIKGKCLNHIRSDKKLYSKGPYLGWHFTSMGGEEEVRRKLDASYTADSYNTFEVQQMLPERLKQGVDYLGRNFKFTLDESEWPEYLKENKDKYAHLCRS